MKTNLNSYVDTIFKQVGEFGPYQMFVFILASTGGFIISFFGLSFSFYGATPSHRFDI